MEPSRSTKLVLGTLMTLLVVVGGAPAVSAHGGKNRGKNRWEPQVVGMVYVESDRSFETTWNALVAALEANPNIRVVDKVDHAAAAKSVGLKLDPNRVVFFGNPNLGTPLMQVNQTVGIDLPQKIQVFERRGAVWVGFNDATYLQARHGLGEVATLDVIAGALRNLASVATDEDVGADDRAFGARRFARRPGLTTAVSDADVDTTWNRLLAAIKASPASTAFTVDHQAGAASVDLKLRPTRLVVFGNPQIGTPLMQRSPTAGVDLPLKILVWEGPDGHTYVTTNTERLGRRHRLTRRSLAPAATAVGNFVDAAIGH